MNPEQYTQRELNEDKIRLKRRREELEAKIEDRRAEYNRLIEEAASADEQERRTTALRAKLAKKKYEIAIARYRKIKRKLAMVLAIETVREFTRRTDEMLGHPPDEGIDVDAVEQQLNEVARTYAVDADVLTEALDELDFDGLDTTELDVRPNDGSALEDDLDDSELDVQSNEDSPLEDDLDDSELDRIEPEPVDIDIPSDAEIDEITEPVSDLFENEDSNDDTDFEL
jgi:hypothetical protein